MTEIITTIHADYEKNQQMVSTKTIITSFPIFGE